MQWQPNVGKWYDDENYDIKEPLWKRMLNLSAQHTDRKRLIEILSWFSQKNMYGDDYKLRLIGCFLLTKGVNLEEHVSETILSDIVALAGSAKTIDECALNLLNKANAPEEFIDEFRMQFAEKNDEV